MEQKLANVEHQLETAKVEVTKPFAQEEELAEKLERLAELNALLNMDEKAMRVSVWTMRNRKPGSRTNRQKAVSRTGRKIPKRWQTSL